MNDTAYRPARRFDLLAPLALLVAGLLSANALLAQPTRKTIGDLTDASSVATTDEVMCYQTGGLTKACTFAQILGLANAAGWGEYDPRNPDACVDGDASNVCEEYTGDTEAETWAWFNQDSATVSYEYDGAKIVGDSANDETRGRCFSTPSSGAVDFSLHARVSYDSASGTTGCGLLIVTGGTSASPTEVKMCYFNTTPNTSASIDSDFNWASGASQVGSVSMNDHSMNMVGTDLRLTWHESGNTWDCDNSLNGGRLWRSAVSGAAASGDPPEACIMVRDAATCHFEWVRLRIDADQEVPGG